MATLTNRSSIYGFQKLVLKQTLELNIDPEDKDDLAEDPTKEYKHRALTLKNHIGTIIADLEELDEEGFNSTTVEIEDLIEDYRDLYNLHDEYVHADDFQKLCDLGTQIQNEFEDIEQRAYDFFLNIE